MPKHTVIRHPSQLQQLSNLPFTRRPPRGRLRLADTFDGARRPALEAALNRHYYACGCSEGAKGLLLGLLSGTLLAATAYVTASSSGGQAVAILFGGVVIGALTGKVVGLLRAHERLQSTVREATVAWRGKWPRGEPIACG